MMITKFEAKSKRVKGLSFHKYRPWILASLHNGSINLFDYRASVLIEKFEDHDGPVRGVNFHETQPLFVSGGDDHKVKVWNYKTKKCLFTLSGHLDYIRTVEFHKELPWICSSSDDQTVRIWNWQNRSVIAILTGHSHYVMAATFHPEENLLASASLDQTIRIWDFSKLKEKSMQKTGSRPNEIFGGTEVEVKHIIEGHEKGVNWVAFHPTSRIVASGADDKTIKLWRLSGNKHWEMDTLKGHANNVSCVLFHPRMEILISNSEDKTLRFWDLNRRVQISQTRKDTDRFWILAAHPSLNYFAAGYDNGMIVFKIERENFASVRSGSHIFYVKNKNLCYYDLSTKDKQIMAAVNTNGKQVLLNQPKSVYYNQFNQSSHDIILNFEMENGCFIIYEFHKDLKNIRVQSEKRGDFTTAAVFISKDKICVLDQNKELAVCNFDGSNLKKLQVNKKGPGKIEMLYPGSLGKIIIYSDESLQLYDIAARKVLYELSCTDVKQVYWNNQFTYCVIVTKQQIIMTNKNLEIINQQKENSKIKTGCFDENQAFVYSTSTHIKYMFCEGKTTGTFKSIDEPVYMSFFMKNQAFAFNRQGDLNQIEVNNTDYLFKLALQQKNLNEVKEILSEGNLCGHSIVSYLKEQGHSEIALFFESDIKQRFNLALASGNIQVAFDAAKELKEKDNFQRLAQTAILLGNLEAAEKCFQIIRSFDKLNFFYATTGSLGKLRKMQVVAQSVNDHTLRFNTSIYTGDIQERVKVLAETGQIPLAYLMAKTHGLKEFEHTLEETIRGMEGGVDPEQILQQAEKFSRRGKVLLPLRPLFVQNESYQQREWPMINMRAEEAKRAALMFQKKREPELADSDDMFLDAKEYHTSNKQVANILSSINNEPTAKPTGSATLLAEGDAWGDDEIDITEITDNQEATELDQANQNTEATPNSDIFVPPSQGSDPLQSSLRKNPNVAALHITLGDFVKGMELLKRQLAIADFEPLRNLFIDVYTLNKQKIQTLPHVQPLDYTLRQSGNIPYVSVTLNSLIQKIHPKTPKPHPSMLARLPAEKREEMKEMYHRMKQEQSDHLKIDIKEDDIENLSPEQMMMGMTGSSSMNNMLMPPSTGTMDGSGGMFSAGAQSCPMMNGATGSSGGSETTQDSSADQMNFQDMFENDPQAFMERMAKMQEGGGSCPMMGAKYFDPFNQKMEFGWNCLYKSRWAFLLNHKGRLTTRKFLQERKLMERLPYPMKHTLFHPDDLKKLRDKPFSGLYFHFDKYKEEANKHFKDEEYFEALEYYEQIMSVFKWLEFTDKEKNDDFFKALKLDPILDRDIKVGEKDLEGDDCEIEMRTNLVVTLLMSMGYCYQKLFFFNEAMKCFNYAIEIAPEAMDVYLRRSQCIMYNKESTMQELKQAVTDVNKAINKRPKDKFYASHKAELENVIQNYLTNQILFVREMIGKADSQIALKRKLKLRRQKYLEETKGVSKNSVDEEKQDSDDEEVDEKELTYPEECRVLDIMKDKYYDAVQFFHDTEDKKQLGLAVKEYQRFCYLYQKMSKYLEFDPTDIEEDIYQRLSEQDKDALSNPKIIREINVIRRRKAAKILEDEDVNILNFQMFQYALKLFHKEKKKAEKAEEERKKAEEERLNPGKQQQIQNGSMTKLVLINLIFFMVVAGGIIFASGTSIFDMFGGLSYFAAKKKDEGL